MARPKKDPSLVKNVPVKIMVTADQKSRIIAAAADQEYTAWARAAIMGAVEKVEERAHRVRKKT